MLPYEWEKAGLSASAQLSQLPLQFTKAVESKQVAQQEAERARFVVMKADQVGAELEHVK